MAHARVDAVSGPSLDAILQAMAEASVGDLRVRVDVPADADQQAPLTMLAHALNILLGDLEHRERKASLQSERLRTLLAHLPSGVAIAEAPHGRIVFHNPAVERILGVPAHTPERFEAYAAHAPAFHEDGRAVEPHEWPLARAIERREVVHEKLLEIRPPGRPPRWLSCNAAPVLDPSGAVLGGIVVFEDITEDREARRREAASEAFHRGLLEGISDAGLGFVVSDGRRVLTTNEAFARMLARPA